MNPLSRDLSIGHEAAPRPRRPRFRFRTGSATRILTLAAAFASATLLPGCGESPTTVTPVCGESPTIVPGDPISAMLDSGDRVRDDAPVDYYTLRLGRTGTVSFRMQAPAFSPFLYLFDADGKVVAQGFDSRGGSTATIKQSLSAGCFTIGAGAWAAGSTGDYTLEVEIE